MMTIPEIAELLKKVDQASQILYLACQRAKLDRSLDTLIALNTASREFGDVWADAQNFLRQYDREGDAERMRSGPDLEWSARIKEGGQNEH
ncbi:MAG: hypothetical protein ACRD2L_04670 [Terriglobia bacterium]